MSTMTSTAVSSGDDFERWEAELSPTYRPTKAAQRREDREAVDRGRGFRRHRTSEREAF